jgi:uncharacterized membrane protein
MTRKPNIASRLNGQLAQDIDRRRRVIRSLRTKEDEKRSLNERIADKFSEIFGSMTFLAVNVVFFAGWIVLNTNIIPGVEPFDPFPFGFLTMAVSLEAIILAILVLIAQNRAAKIGELREETDLQIDILTEEELTKLLHMVALLLEKHGVDNGQDEELKEMLEPTDVDALESELEEQIIPGRNVEAGGTDGEA